jgi:hypothetical protein
MVVKADEREQLKIQFKKLTMKTASNSEDQINIIHQNKGSSDSRGGNQAQMSSSSSKPNGGNQQNVSNRTNRAGGCFRCGQDHPKETCKFLNAKCYYCGTQGHIAKVCMKKKSANSGNNSNNNNSNNRGNNQGNRKNVNEINNDKEDDGENFQGNVYQIREQGIKSIRNIVRARPASSVGA